MPNGMTAPIVGTVTGTSSCAGCVAVNLAVTDPSDPTETTEVVMGVQGLLWMALVPVWGLWMIIYIVSMVIVRKIQGKSVPGWSRPKTESELLLAAGSPDIWQKSLVPPDPDRLRGCGDFFLHTRDDGTYDCRHCGVPLRVHN